MTRAILVAVCLLGAGGSLAADPVLKSFIPNTTAKADEVNANFQNLVDKITALEAKVQAGSVPVGTVLAFAGTAVPAGFLMCDGSQVNRTTYAALFDVIGTTHGAGNLTTTFHLPDYRGRFLRGVSGTSGRDRDAATRTAMATGGFAGNLVGSVQDYATAAPKTTVLTISTTGNHTHQDPTSSGTPGPYEVPPAGGQNNFDYGVQSAPTAPAGAHTHSLTGFELETRPINANVNWIIKY